MSGIRASQFYTTVFRRLAKDERLHPARRLDAALLLLYLDKEITIDVFRAMLSQNKVRALTAEEEKEQLRQEVENDIKVNSVLREIYKETAKGRTDGGSE